MPKDRMGYSSYGVMFVTANVLKRKGSYQIKIVCQNIVWDKDRSGKVREDECSLTNKIVIDNDRMPKDRMRYKSYG